MADGYARVSGKPGVCTLITGPGVTNASTPIGQAFADSIPMLVISSENATYTLGKGWGCLHEITNQQAVTEPLTALSATALAPGDVPELIGQAFLNLFRLADAGPYTFPFRWMCSRCQRPGIGSNGKCRIKARLIRTLSTPRPRFSAKLSVPRSCSAAVRKPLGGLAIAELAKLIGAGIVPSNAGKGIVPDSHPLNLGTSMVKTPTQAFCCRVRCRTGVGNGTVGNRQLYQTSAAQRQAHPHRYRRREDSTTNTPPTSASWPMPRRALKPC